MLEPIDGFSDPVVALRGVGTVTAGDYRDVLIPAVTRATAGDRMARLLLELGDDFDGYDLGAVRADAGVGIGNFGSFDRIAVVTDHGGIRAAVGVFGVFIPGDVRLYTVAEAADARTWIGEGANAVAPTS